jgi:nuclease S1
MRGRRHAGKPVILACPSPPFIPTMPSTRSRSAPRARGAALACAALLLGLAAGPALAWGKLGHRLVGALAADELTPTARAEVARLLAGEPEPTLAGISTWADDLRANDPDLGRRSARWHYVNIGEAGCRYQAADACPDGDCVVEAIRAQAAILADRDRGDAARRQALKFVVHFVADVHQPLHAGFARDRGGNTIQVRVPEAFIPPWAEGNPGSNLHAVWDGGLLHSAGLDEAAYLAHLRALPLALPVLRDPLPPPAGRWAEESCAIVLREGFLPARAELGTGYYATWRPLADERLRRAGSRLAAVLNAALAPAP